jgi:signal transduction histidine kinase
MFAFARPAILLFPITWVVAWWKSLEPARKLSDIAAVIVLAAMAYVSMFVSNRIEDAMGHRYAAATALYMDNVVSPHVQELAFNRSLSEENRAALEKLLSPASIGRPVISFRIWTGNRIAFSSQRDLIGRSYSPSPDLVRALEGHFVANFELEGEDNIQERALHVPILEIYAPVREAGTGRIIAAAETYELAIELKKEIFAAQCVAVIGIGSIGLSIIFIIFTLAARLQTRIGELSVQHARETQLRKRVCRASGRVLETNERQLWGVGQQLHSGPLQHVALALLKMDALRDAGEETCAQCARTRVKDVSAICGALKASLSEMRSIAERLASAEIERLTLEQSIKLAAYLHEQKTGVEVDWNTISLPRVSYSLRTCVYSFVCEGLQAMSGDIGCNTVKIRAISNSDKLEILILDQTGDDSGATAYNAEHDCSEDWEIWSATTWDRIAALGGSLAVHMSNGRPTCLALRFRSADLETSCD